MHNFLYIYRRKSPAGKKHTYTHIEKGPSTLKQMRTFQSWIEKSTVELKKKGSKIQAFNKCTLRRSSDNYFLTN